MINIIFILSLIILLFFLLKNNEKFLNPNAVFRYSGNVVKKLRPYRKCGKNIQCVLEKAPVMKYDNIKPPPFRKEVNYSFTGNIQHLFPQHKPTRVTPNT